jgi:hypothetical protein
MKIGPLIKGIKELEKRSSTGELAFLCLNGKSENHLRDLIAFNIAVNKPDWSVEREEDHVDLKLKSTKGAELNVEFKVGYAGGVIGQRERSQVISGALKDVEKRNIEIVNCIAIMDFNAKKEVDLVKYRKSSLIRRTLNDEAALQKVKGIIKGTFKKAWENSRCRFTTVNCGEWGGIEVTIMFCTIQYE